MLVWELEDLDSNPNSVIKSTLKNIVYYREGISKVHLLLVACFTFD